MNGIVVRMSEDLTSKTLFDLVCILNRIQIEQDKIGVRVIELEKERLLVIKEICRRLPDLKEDKDFDIKTKVK